MKNMFVEYLQIHLQLIKKFNKNNKQNNTQAN